MVVQGALMLSSIRNSIRRVTADAEIIQQVIHGTYVASGYRVEQSGVEVRETGDGAYAVSFNFVVGGRE